MGSTFSVHNNTSKVVFYKIVPCEGVILGFQVLGTILGAAATCGAGAAVGSTAAAAAAGASAASNTVSAGLTAVQFEKVRLLRSALLHERAHPLVLHVLAR